MKMRQLISLAFWIVLFQGIGFGIGYLMRGSVDGWYETLIVSPLTPPKHLFRIVWPALYALLACSGWLLWQDRRRSLDLYKVLFVLQMVINWSWTPVFFHFKWLTGALGLIVAMVLLTSMLIVACYQKRLYLSAVLLVPYLGWITFAGYLNYFIVLHN